MLVILQIVILQILLLIKKHCRASIFKAFTFFTGSGVRDFRIIFVLLFLRVQSWFWIEFSKGVSFKSVKFVSELHLELRLGTVKWFSCLYKSFEGFTNSSNFAIILIELICFSFLCVFWKVTIEIKSAKEFRKVSKSKTQKKK